MTERTSTGTLDDGFGAVAPIRILAPGSSIGSRYEVRRVLGTGGSAVVYSAYDRELKRSVALKVLRADRMTGATLKRFRREVAVARDASSPHLVKTYDIGQAGEAVYLTMEEVDGESLRGLLEKGRLPLDEVLRIAIDALRGLAALHGLGIVHRDIKPGNILLTGEGVAKLADFGLARRVEGDESRVTETLATMVGTAEYLSPEQALGEELDARSDLYSFGVLLFEMASGEVPFRRTSSIGTVMAHMKERPRPLRDVAPGTPRWLSEIVSRLLEKDPERRYPDAKALLLDLERRSSTAEPLWKRRRVRVRLAAAAAAIVCLAWGVAWRGRPRLANVVVDRASGLRGVDGAGRTLWKRDDCAAPERAALARLEAGKAPAVLAVLARPGDLDQERLHRLSVLDPETGALRGEVQLERPGPDRFPQFSDTFVPARIFPVDLDGDGVDEIFVTFSHRPYWPSYTSLVDPRRSVARLVFVATGHHLPVAAVDVDGDGRKELILSGPNNRFGYQSGVAAVRVQAPPDPRSVVPPACTPDAEHGRVSEENLAWYAIGPAFNGRPRADAGPGGAGTRIVFFGEPGRAFRLRLDGFDEESTSALEPARRQQVRAGVYRSLREAARLTAAGYFAEAEAAIGRASGDARTVGDPNLDAWASRQRAQALIRTGRLGEAEEAVRPLLGREETRPEVCLEVARALNLVGERERAVAWYDRSFGSRPSAYIGRPNEECVLEAVLTLGEMGRWKEAGRWISRYRSADTLEAIGARTAYFDGYCRWRAGQAVEPIPDLPDGVPDILRYWRLEFLLASGGKPEALLPEVERELLLASDTRPMVKSLRAELLLRTGDAGAAFRAGREAFEEALSASGRDVVARAHVDLVAGRFARIAEKAGRPGEARRAAAEGERAKRSGKAGARAASPRPGAGPGRSPRAAGAVPRTPASPAPTGI